MSAAQMAKNGKLSGNKLFNHLKVLERFEVVTLIEVKKVRGGKENLYASQVVGHATVEVILADTEEEDGHVWR